MKSRRTILVFFILTSLLACEPPVTFTEPQPIATKNLSKFPKRIQGEYVSVEDRSQLLITDKYIQRIYDFDDRFNRNDLDSTSRLSGDTLINLVTNEKAIVKHDGDSLIIHKHYVDTLFQMDYDNVVRKFKGYYFLNQRYGKTSWEVKKVQIAKGQLTISSISSKTDIDNLREILELPTDTVLPYKFTPTRRQLKKFVRNDGFSTIEIFVKQKR